MLNKSESMNFVTSCHQTESTVVAQPVGKVWEALKSLLLHKSFPSHVKNVKFTSGSDNEIGSIFEVEYIEGSVWTFRIVEISEKKRRIAYELIGAVPETTFSSMLTTIKVQQVTEDNSTFLTWETDYSNDVNAHVIQDGKFKKLDYFKDLKKLLK